MEWEGVFVQLKLPGDRDNLFSWPNHVFCGVDVQASSPMLTSDGGGRLNQSLEAFLIELPGTIVFNTRSGPVSGPS